MDLHYYQPMDPEQGMFPVLEIHSVMQVRLSDWAFCMPLDMVHATAFWLFRHEECSQFGRRHSWFETATCENEVLPGGAQEYALCWQLTFEADGAWHGMAWQGKIAQGGHEQMRRRC